MRAKLCKCLSQVLPITYLQIYERMLGIHQVSKGIGEKEFIEGDSV